MYGIAIFAEFIPQSGTAMAIPGGGTYKKKKTAPAGAGVSLIF